MDDDEVDPHFLADTPLDMIALSPRCHFVLSRRDGVDGERTREPRPGGPGVARTLRMGPCSDRWVSAEESSSTSHAACG